MIEIIPKKITHAVVSVPGSKSYTHRTLIASALSNGPCKIKNWLDSEDTRYTLSALTKLGIRSEFQPDGIYIQGAGGAFKPYQPPIDLGNSGTSMRLLTALAVLGTGDYIFTGTERMHKRPIQDLLDALNQLGISAQSLQKNGCPPVKITAGKISSAYASVNCSVSSQFLSGLLLISPLAPHDMHVHVSQGPVSKPYIDMTLEIMSEFGVRTMRNGYIDFFVPGNQTYQSGEFSIEPDASNASYFWAAAAVTGSTVKVLNISQDSKQGDLNFIHVLKSMGCRISVESDGISVTGGALCGIEVDMGDMPDLVPTLAVVAAFAKGQTHIQNIAHLKAKESDRLAAVIKELGKMGIKAWSENNDLKIMGGIPRGAVIETYNDHRMAMSFAVTGLVTPNVVIANEKCVEKSFPQFWDTFQSL